jgi:hypothetical protein
VIRRLIFALGLSALLSGTPAVAQNFTAVSGTILDPNSLPYSNCAITAELVPAGTNPTINGAAIGGLNRASCDVNGNFSMTLGSNAVILPGGTQWKFTVTEVGIAPPAGFGPQSFSTIITISGASQNISAALAVPALALARGGAGGPIAGLNAVDTGTHANGALGAPNWTITSGALNYASNQIQGATTGINSAYWTSNSFSNIQSMQVSVSALNGTTDLIGATVLNQTSGGANFYDCVENSTTLFLRKVVNGTATNLQTVASTGNVNDVLIAAAFGGSLVCSKNGVPLLTALDATFSAGNTGIEVDGNVGAIISVIGSNVLNTNNCSNATVVTANANVATDQNLMACLLPIGVLALPSRTTRAYLAGVYSTPAASTSTITVKVNLCNVSGCGSGTVLPLLSITSSALGTIQATNNPFSVDLACLTLQTGGVISSYECHGNLRIGLSAANTAAQSTFADNSIAPIGTLNSSGAPLFLQTTIAFSNASASNSATAREFIVRSD